MPDNASNHILLVEDTASLGQMYQQYLEKQGYKVTNVLTATDALNYITHNDTCLVLLDLKLPDMNGLEVMEELKNLSFDAPIIIITGHGSINTAVDAMRKGAWDFLVKPFNVDRLGEAVTKAIKFGSFGKNLDDHMTDADQQDNMGDIPRVYDNDTAPDSTDAKKRTQASEQAKQIDKTGENISGFTNDERHKPNFGGFIGTSNVMQQLYKQLENAAKSQAPVFVTGQSGTGKEICAEAIHKYSHRSDQPFVPINCAAIPRDLIESELFGHEKGAFTGAITDRDGAAKLADGGTLFLDEIGEMDVSMQTKLLRFLQNYTFQKVGGSRLERTDVRIICATNRNPHQEIQNGTFREDLFYRLHVIPIHMPPLNQRGEDIIDLAQALLLRYAKEENKAFKDFSREAENKLINHRWPGNIRELQNVVRNIVVMNNAEIVTASMLPEYLSYSQNSYPHTGSEHDKEAMTSEASGQEIPPKDQRNNGALDILAGVNSEAHYTQPLQRTLSEDDIKPLWLTEKEAIEKAIALCGGNIPRAAAMLEVSPSTIYRKKSAWDTD